jgi:hypothetical protein
MDRTWIREVGDLGAALPAVIGLDRVARERLVEVTLGTSGPAHGGRCYLVVIGEGLSSAQVAIVTGIVERVGSPSRHTLEEVTADLGRGFRASGSANAIVVATNAWLRGRSRKG